MTVLRVYTSFQLVFWGSAKKNSLWALNFSLFFHNDFRLFSLLTLGLKRPVPQAEWALWRWQRRPQPGDEPWLCNLLGKSLTSWCLPFFMYQTGRMQPYGNRVEIKKPYHKEDQILAHCLALSRRSKQNIPYEQWQEGCFEDCKAVLGNTSNCILTSTL